jgi:hypothetical protein
MTGTQVIGIIFGVLVIVHALNLIGSGISFFVTATFVLAGVSIIGSAIERG